MPKNNHEIRDPVHAFVRIETSERDVLASAPLQRLRQIHQLAMTYLVYPGATHKRFEHSLGVMELASRVYDIVTEESARHSECRDLYPAKDTLTYWRHVLRLAALCHDIGHLPFSHANEKELLPKDWDHERLTYEIIMSPEMAPIWHTIRPAVAPLDIAKIAVGPGAVSGVELNDWETILSEIIVGSAFGVDRMDYLLRDSLHAGVAYGKFDHYRLIDTLRILPKSYEEGSAEPSLGIEEGGLHSAEALALARHFMFTQLYCHPVRRIYDTHLKDFLKSWLPNGQYPIDVAGHLRWTDSEILAGLNSTAATLTDKSYEYARRIVDRDHYKLLYSGNPEDHKLDMEAEQHIYEAACEKFGADAVRYDPYYKKSGIMDFPVLTKDGPVVSAFAFSEILLKVPAVRLNYVFIRPKLRDAARTWLSENKKTIINTRRGEN